MQVPKIQSFWGDRGHAPSQNFEILDPQIAGNTFKISILLSPGYFVSL